MRPFARIIRHAAKRAARRVLVGRLVARDDPTRGRLLRGDVDRLIDRAEDELRELIAEADLERLPTRGNRHNVMLAAFTIAAYHALIERGVKRAYAMELVADVGWNVYVGALTVPTFLARLRYRDPQKRLEFILRTLMVYPFSAPGKPGYEVETRSEPDRYWTFWRHCPPLEAVRDHIERHGDRGELEAFRRSWCSYDWAATGAMVGERGRYERSHTMSAGDDVCDMCWYVRPPIDTSGKQGA